MLVVGVNATGSLRFEATKGGEDAALSQIVRMVEEAQGSKATIHTRATEGMQGSATAALAEAFSRSGC